MTQLPEALAALAGFPQFILWKMSDGKKLPIDYRTGGTGDAHNTGLWLAADVACAMAPQYGPEYGVGFVFTKDDPFFFLDIDKCLNPDGATWSPLAMELMGRLPGAAVEVSQSGRGLHIFGRGAPLDHACKNVALGIEFYTEGRFVALTGTNALGDAGLDCSAMLPALVASYFPPKGSTKDQDWTTSAVDGWDGITDDQELINKALASNSAAGIFGGRSSFSALWNAEEDALAKSYPDTEGDRAYDGSSADAALAQHLAFWTGNNCERIQSLMQQSALVREKWEREDYLVRTILRAASLQDSFHGVTPEASTALADKYGAPKLRGTPAQQKFAESIREAKLATATEEEAAKLCESSGKVAQAKTWLNAKEATATELVAMIQPIAAAAAPLGSAEKGAEIVTGHQYLSANLQIEHFAGCVYIQDQHRIFTPSGAILKSEQFNATFGGYSFQLDETGDKTTRKAWDAFTESQVVRYPKAESTCFRPELDSAALITEESRVLVNTYVPIATPRTEGDVNPFLSHLAKILPNQDDQATLLAYMAACVQHQGVKFQWAPLLQGTEGNGKTLFTRCVAFAVGGRYTHLPPANEISEKFNEWLFNKIFIGIEDVYVPDHKKEIIEVLKPMITNDKLAMRAMQQSQVMGDNRANFMLNSNHKDAIRKTRNDRRFAVFFSAQQSTDDLTRDNMNGDYFPNLYGWLREGGYAKVANYLAEYAIPDALNPATSCHRAPVTSSTDEAISASLGGIEQEVLEAIDENRPGFAGGWISSVALDRLLQSMRAARTIPPNKRRDLLKSLGYDWHPSLKNGRVNNPIPLDDNKKPRLFIKGGHLALNLATPGEVAKAYLDAQGGQPQAVGAAVEVFSR